MRHSKDIPRGWRAAYRRAQADPSLIGLRDETALVDALIAEKLKALQRDEPDWPHVRGVFERLKAAVRVRDVAIVSGCLSDLDAAINENTQAEGLRASLVELIDRRRRLVVAEAKRVRAMSQVMTAEQAMALVAALTQAVKDTVCDPVVLSRINTKFQALLTERDAT